MFSAKQASSKFSLIVRSSATLPIIAYQKTVSFDHGPLKVLYPHGYCRFHPSCSEYTRLAIMKYGIVRGIARGSWRILRCNPWSVGGVDLP